MDIGYALTFITEDPRWKEKLGIGVAVILISTVLSSILVGVLGFLIVMGYCIRLTQNVRDGVQNPLPEWDQWGDDMVRGLKLFLAILVWSLPILLLSIPMVIGGAISDGNNGAGAAIGGLILACGFCLVIVYSLALALLQPGITVAFAANENFSDALKIQAIWEWTRSRIGEVVIVTLVYLAASFALGLIGLIVGTILCVIGLIVTLPLSTLATYLFQHHLYGQLAREPGSPVKPATRPVEPAPIVPTSVDPEPAMTVDLGADSFSEEVEDIVVDLTGDDAAEADQDNPPTASA